MQNKKTKKKPKKQSGFTKQPEGEKDQIRSFRDLDVYREAIVISSEVIHELAPKAQKRGYPNTVKLMQAVLLIPVLIADGYGTRYYDAQKGHQKLRFAALLCDRIVCYCDQISEIYASSGEKRICQDMREKYFFTRLKIQNLLRSWQNWTRSQSNNQRFQGNNSNQNGRRYQNNYYNKNFRKGA